MIILDRYQCERAWPGPEIRYCVKAHNSLGRRWEAGKGKSSPGQGLKKAREHRANTTHKVNRLPILIQPGLADALTLRQGLENLMAQAFQARLIQLLLTH